MIKTNEDHQVDLIGNYLANKSIALCVTGGIAAIETPKIARQLRRYGAEVHVYMTPSANQFIGKTSLEWGSGNEVITSLSGLSEHICREDAVLVAPATTNTINKICTGLADNAVTTLIASALGMHKPIYLAPCMHESLYNNPFLQENLQRAQQYNINIIQPRFSEGKAKIAKLENIVAKLSHDLTSDPIKGKNILITAGPTPVKIDDVRRITNKFKGTLGKLIAQEAYLRGANVKLLMGDTGIPVPTYLTTQYHSDFDQYLQNVCSSLEQKPYNIGIFSAAVADFKPTTTQKGKISSSGELHLDFEHTQKVIQLVRERYPQLYMATFKYEEGISQEQLFQIAENRIAKGYELVVANRKEDYINGKHAAYIIGTEGLIANPQDKEEIASSLISILGKRYIP